MTAKLKLGPIPEDKPVKLTVEIPAVLADALRDYARIHAEATGLTQPLPVEKLIAPIVARFIATDRAFARKRRAQTG